MTGRSLGGQGGAPVLAALGALGTSLIAQGGAPATAGRLAAADRSTMPDLPAGNGGWGLAGISALLLGWVLGGIMAAYITIWELFRQSGVRVAGGTAEGGAELFRQPGPRLAGVAVVGRS